MIASWLLLGPIPPTSLLKCRYDLDFSDTIYSARRRGWPVRSSSVWPQYRLHCQSSGHRYLPLQARILPQARHHHWMRSPVHAVSRSCRPTLADVRYHPLVRPNHQGLWVRRLAAVLRNALHQPLRRRRLRHQRHLRGPRPSRHLQMPIGLQRRSVHSMLHHRLRCVISIFTD